MIGPGVVDVSIVTSGHDVADARLHREVAALRRAGLRVEVLGLGDPAAGPAGAVVRTWRRRGPVGRALLAIRLPWAARAPVLVALDPDSTTGAWLRRALGRLVPPLRGRPALVADVHEDYTLVLRDRAWASSVAGALGAVWARLGRATSRRADLTVVADEHLEPDAPRRLVLRNLPDVEMLPGPHPREGEPRAVYVGDLRASRGLDAMLDAIEAAPGWTLDLVGPVAAADRTRMLARIAALDGRVRWHDRLPPREAWALTAGAWVGLLLLEDTRAFRDAVPSKLYEYLACGLAVVTTPLPRSAAIVRSSGAGQVTERAGVAAVLRRWQEHPEELDACRAAAKVWAESLPSEPAAPFAAAVAELVRRTSR